jgi:hypothetical protein
MNCKSSNVSGLESSSHWAASIRGARPWQPALVEATSLDHHALALRAATSTQLHRLSFGDPPLLGAAMSSNLTGKEPSAASGSSARMPHNKSLERSRDGPV